MLDGWRSFFVPILNRTRSRPLFNSLNRLFLFSRFTSVFCQFTRTHITMKVSIYYCSTLFSCVCVELFLHINKSVAPVKRSDSPPVYALNQEVKSYSSWVTPQIHSSCFNVNTGSNFCIFFWTIWPHIWYLTYETLLQLLIFVKGSLFHLSWSPPPGVKTWKASSVSSVSLSVLSRGCRIWSVHEHLQCLSSSDAPLWSPAEAQCVQKLK